MLIGNLYLFLCVSVPVTYVLATCPGSIPPFTQWQLEIDLHQQCEKEKQVKKMQR